MLKSNILHVYSHKYTKIKINSNDDDLLLKISIAMCTELILIKSVFDENHNL